MPLAKAAPAQRGLVTATVNHKTKVYLNLKYNSSHCFLGFWKLVKTKLISLLCLFIYWREVCPMGGRLMWMWALCSMEQGTERQWAWKKAEVLHLFCFPLSFHWVGALSGIPAPEGYWQSLWERHHACRRGRQGQGPLKQTEHMQPMAADQIHLRVLRQLADIIAKEPSSLKGHYSQGWFLMTEKR